MENCPYAKKDERSGKLLCWYWGFYDEDDDGGLELISVEGKDCKRAVAIPELCGVCEITDAFELKEKVERIESGLRKLGFFQGG